MVGRALSKYDRPARSSSNFRFKMFCFQHISHSRTNRGRGSIWRRLQISPCCGGAGRRWQILGSAKSQSGRAGLPPKLDWAALLIELEYSIGQCLSMTIISAQLMIHWNHKLVIVDLLPSYLSTRHCGISKSCY